MHRLRAMSTIPLLASSIVLAALFLALGEGNTSDQTAGASSTGISPEFVALTSALVKPAVGSVSRIAATGSQPSAQSLALLSHRVVTDPALAADLHSLSRYEIEALRRRAKFGDDSAALLLGMAYETGTYVPQDCRRAASLIAQAANAGSAAAQYNLGLRYRTGDGVPTDVQLGMQWLTKAASRNYAQAKHALQSKP